MPLPVAESGSWLIHLPVVLPAVPCISGILLAFQPIHLSLESQHCIFHIEL
jgi:hypothetical protein